MVGFFEKLSRGWYLTKVSLRILWEEKQLLLLPVISGAMLIVVCLGYIIGLVGLVVWTNLLTDGGGAGIALLIVLCFSFYVTVYFLIIYFNSALIHCATVKLQGGKPTLGEGFRKANESLKLILMWAVTAATVGMIIRVIQERFGIIGRMIGALAGVAWAVAVYFVVPVIIYERLTPWAAIKRSTQIMNATWGESFGGTFGMGIVFALLALLSLPVLIVGGYLAAVTANIWIFVGLFIGAVVYWLTIVIFAVAAEGILLAALYRYAVTGELSPGFAPTVLSNPWADGYYRQS